MLQLVGWYATGGPQQQLQLPFPQAACPSTLCAQGPRRTWRHLQEQSLQPPLPTTFDGQLVGDTASQQGAACLVRFDAGWPGRVLQLLLFVVS